MLENVQENSKNGISVNLNYMEILSALYNRNLQLNPEYGLATCEEVMNIMPSFQKLKLPTSKNGSGFFQLISQRDESKIIIEP